MVNSLSGQRAALGSLEGRFYQSQDTGEAWIAGWSQHGAVLIQPQTGRAIRVDSADSDLVLDLTIAGSTIGALSDGPDGSRVRLYSRD